MRIVLNIAATVAAFAVVSIHVYNLGFSHGSSYVIGLTEKRTEEIRQEAADIRAETDRLREQLPETSSEQADRAADIHIESNIAGKSCSQCHVNGEAFSAMPHGSLDLPLFDMREFEQSDDAPRPPPQPRVQPKQLRRWFVDPESEKYPIT